jgi:hypothetical protein
MTKPAQPNLFDFTDAPEPRVAVSASLQITPRHALPLSRWQREFNALSADVLALRSKLADTQELLDSYRSHLSKVYEPRWRDLLAARRDWVLAADRVLQRQEALPKTQRLSRKRQKHLSEHLLAALEDLLQELGHDDEALITIHDRYNDITLDESRALEQALVQSIMEDAVGVEAMQGVDDDSIESILRHAQAQLQARLDAAAHGREGKAQGRPTKESLKREQAAKDITQSVRDVYRKLASSLHPDREPDATERARKTELMQQANQAYAQGDLVQLLTLQMSVLQADQNALAQADDARLKLYCQALREQRQVLAAEVADLEAPIRHGLQRGPRGPMPERQAMLAHIDADTKQLKRGVAQVRQDMANLLDPRLCGALVDSLQLPSDEPDLSELEELLMQGVPTRRGRRR